MVGLGRVAPLAGSVDRNRNVFYGASTTKPSLPSRGAWIEIPLRFVLCGPFGVAPLAGSVDRNKDVRKPMGDLVVAPLAGSVDRNPAG